MKTSKLTGAALDWAVAVAAKRLGTWIRSPNPKRLGTSIMDIGVGEDGKLHAWSNYKDAFEPFTPSTNWSQGGPIIEREKIDLHHIGSAWTASIYAPKWHARDHEQFSPTPLAAAMRCFVASRLGDEVDIPKELM